ncbi:tRNA splicing endonuclease subunit 34 [Rhynchophorus ferrugineus]|uniref:tRNA splicing endonuclease subunit 34 n=1 Tax=Rhynchophorus ferrugineus TaxID=354439 RepID=UPI003FCC3E10
MIILYLINDDIFTFNVEDWIKLRKQYRIIGQIVGSTSFIPSLPAKILPEEALLLLNNNFAVIHSSCGNICDNLKENNFEDEFLKAQQIEYRQIRKQQLETLIDKIVSKRRENGDIRTKEEILNEELVKSSAITKDNMLWPIFLHKESNLSTPVPVTKIQSLTSSIKSRVFKDLWERNYYVTSGEKFGGDFLVYFGDPITHHAIFIVKCIESEITFHPNKLIAFGRLGVSVKKRAVFATVKDGKITA